MSQRCIECRKARKTKQGLCKACRKTNHVKKKTYIVQPHDDLDLPRAKVRVRARNEAEARRLGREYLDDDILEVIEVENHDN